MKYLKIIIKLILKKYFSKILIDINSKNVHRFLKKIRSLKTEYDLIRIGSNSDGGYILPNDFKGIEFCISPGVSNIFNFELDLLDNYRIKSIMCDGTIEKPKNF